MTERPEKPHRPLPPASSPASGPLEPSSDEAVHPGSLNDPTEPGISPAPLPGPSGTAGVGTPAGVTRAGMVWAAVVTALVLLVLLIIFILQNQTPARIVFLGLDGTVPLGMALFIAAVAGGILVAVAGAARIIQLRVKTRRLQSRQHPS
ncbi:lipopolysaccharide assembly LapA domain-containing protein [bacterium RCC_150]